MIKLQNNDRRSMTHRVIYEKVPNGKGSLWFVDNYFFKSLTAAKKYMRHEDLNDSFFFDGYLPFNTDIVKNPKNIDRSVWFPVRKKDGTWYKDIHRKKGETK
jgi:hypothetical protein|tara:strand:+ start:663 stop:968 length:306 start_codon:yes stop_codon:yes gene_type:complete